MHSYDILLHCGSDLNQKTDLYRLEIINICKSPLLLNKAILRIYMFDIFWEPSHNSSSSDTNSLITNERLIKFIYSILIQNLF